MPSVYPGAFDDENISGNPPRTDLVARLDKIYDMVEAIEHALGLDPAGASATVVDRLNALDVTVGDVEAAIGEQVSSALTFHTDEDDPHQTGKVISPLGPATWFMGGSPPASGPDYDGWVDVTTSE